jgi:hypothetical protein
MDGPRLTSPLDLWRVRLEDGYTVEIAAHAASERSGWISFFALVEGNANREITVASFPARAVADWEGGFPFDGKLATEESDAKEWPRSP